MYNVFCVLNADWDGGVRSFAADDEFQELCFDFGIELDEVVSLQTMYFIEPIKMYCALQVCSIILLMSV